MTHAPATRSSRTGAGGTPPGVHRLRNFALGALGLLAGACMAAPPAPPAPPMPTAPPEPATIDLAELRAEGDRAFAGLDADGDGMITEAEFGQHGGGHAFAMGPGAMQRQHIEFEMPDDEARFAAADTDGDGSLSLEEFRARPHLRPPFPPHPMLHEGSGGHVIELDVEALEAHAMRGVATAFGRMDRNDDGVITRDEWPSPEQHLERMDRDGDGLLTPEEMGAAHAWVTIERDDDAPQQ
ncbi:MAG TPA: EF-hand domain-containing protein [Pseudomonadales bacterium]|nr:EF-hand domain-containing protein [Pseudomonadales bacterium]